MATKQVALVEHAIDFHGDQNNDVWVSVRRMCENIGISRQGQQVKIISDPKFNWNDIVLVANGGKERNSFCLQLSDTEGWLFSINANRVKSEVREKLIRYQRECMQVLHDYWTKGTLRNCGDRLEVKVSLLGDWRVDFVCPDCGNRTDIMETERCTSHTPIRAIEAVSWTYNHEDKPTVTDVDVTYGSPITSDYDGSVGYECRICGFEIGQNDTTADELFEWLRAHGMVRQLTEVPDDPE